ncbi:MAG TPA: PQQ-binding-like beta-propeller repeat protein [Acidimicrobiia bacterium]
MIASRRRPLTVIGIVVLALVLPAVFVARKAAGLRRLGTPASVVTTAAPAPAPLTAAAGPAGGTATQPTTLWTVPSQGRVTDAAIVPALGEVIYVEEVAHRSWRATAVDAHTGKVRWTNARGNTGHIEAWAVTDAAVVLAYHHSASRLAWRTHHAASFEGVDPVSGKVLWTRPIYNLLGERPGDYAPTLASPSDNVVYARTEFGVPNAIDTRTGETLWEHPGLNDCHDAHDIVAGPAGVAVAQHCPDGTERIELLNPRSGDVVWKTEISTPSLRLLAVGTNSVAVYQGGLVSQVIVLGPGGGYASQTPCACGDGAALAAGVVAGTVLTGGPIGLIGVGGAVLVGGPPGLLGFDGATGKAWWQKSLEGGGVQRLVAQDGDVYVVSADGVLRRVVDPATGAVQAVVSGVPGTLGPAAVVAAVGGYILAGSGAGLVFSGPAA